MLYMWYFILFAFTHVYIVIRNDIKYPEGLISSKKNGKRADNRTDTPLRTEKEKQKAGILGLGNLLLSDESFGVHVIEYLTEQHIFPESVTVLDGSTSGIYMAPFLEEHTLMLIVDVLRQQKKVAVRSRQGSNRFHQAGAGSISISDS